MPPWMLDLHDEEVEVGKSIQLVWKPYNLDGKLMNVTVKFGGAGNFTTFEPSENTFSVNGADLDIQYVREYQIRVLADVLVDRFGQLE